MWRKIRFLLLASLMGCAGFSRGCASNCAGAMGSDWLVVQFDQTGRPFNCWRLNGASMANEPGSDGIYWRDPQTGHLVHLSGWYNRVQVIGGGWETAAKHLGVELEACRGGQYR